MTIRVLLVDDQPLLRRGFSLILGSEADLEVVGEAADGQQAIVACQSLRPDVVLMDIRMPVLDGVAATRALVVDAPAGEHRPRVLILTTFDLDQHVADALRAGASGFLLKDVPAEELVAAIRVVAGGEAVVGPTVTRRLIEAYVAAAPRRPADPATTAVLTEREREVLLHLARARSNAEIARALVVSETTVKTHVGNLLLKLGLRDRVQAVVHAYESGLVHPGD